MISVAVIRPDEALKLPFGQLAPFAHNVFMNPVALKAASDTLLAAIYILVAWDMSAEPARLVGFWALQAKQLMLWPLLETLPFNYAFLSTPVLHPDHADDVMPAFLAAIARDRRLPKTLLMRELDGSGRAYSALEPLLAAHPSVTLRRSERPIATREIGIKRSGSTRKKLRQDWNRLSAEGEVAVRNVRDPAEIGAALEAFLDLEARSWKGGGGTALLSHGRDAAFARRLIADLSARGEASVALLTLDGRPIATQVLLYCGRFAYTWKTSFDAEFARFSPGMLLVDRIVTELIDGDGVDLVDSCALSGGFMGQLLAGRKLMRDLVLSARHKRSPAFVMISRYFQLRERVKNWRDRPRQAAGAAAAKPPVSSDPASPAAPSRGSTADRAA